MRWRNVLLLLGGYDKTRWTHEVVMNSTSISLQTNLRALFTRWPETILVFNAHRMICVGCSMASFDTLEDALTNYNLSGDLLLSELRSAVERNPAAAEMKRA